MTRGEITSPNPPKCPSLDRLLTKTYIRLLTETYVECFQKGGILCTINIMELRQSDELLTEEIRLLR
jgi:hypothetical protein